MTEIFISYSHRDEDLRKELDVHLTGIKRQGLIDTWHDRRIVGGSELDKEISNHISTANIILLLVSPNFIASDYCYNVEVSTALKRHEEGSVTVLPVILRPCDWHDLPFGKLLATPKDGKPIVKFPNLDEGFLEVVKEIKRIINKTNKVLSKTSYYPIDMNKTQSKSPIRSSNLRIKQIFSDEDKDKFELETFEYIARYFENSLDELQKRNASTTCRYRMIDSNTFEGIIYIDGQQKSMCTITLRGENGFGGISFSYGRNLNGINESLNVENDGYVQYLKPMGFHFYNSQNKSKLTKEGAAEYYWDLLIRNLQ